MMDNSTASNVSTGDSTHVPTSSLSTLSSQMSTCSATGSISSKTKSVGSFDSMARDDGVKAVLEKRKEDKQNERIRLKKIAADLKKVELDVQAAFEKNMQALKSKSVSCPASRIGSRDSSRKNSKTSLVRNKKSSYSSEDENKVVGSTNISSEKVQSRLNTIENKVDWIMTKLGEVSLNAGAGSTPTRNVSSYEASVHGCLEIQHACSAAIEVLDKAVDTLNMLEGLPSVYASINSRTSLRARYELQNLTALLNDVVVRLKNSKVSYDQILELEIDDCIACASSSELRVRSKHHY